MSRCIVCKSADLTDTENAYEYLSKIFREFFPDLTVKKCNSCGLYQVAIGDTKENNDKLFKYYQSNYRENKQIPDLNDQDTLLNRRGEFIAEMIVRHVDNRSKNIVAFEKGCGFGFNLMHIKRKIPNAVLYTDEMDEHVKPFLKKIGIQAKSWIPNGGGGI